MNRLVPAIQDSLDEYQATVATCSALTAAQRERLLDFEGVIIVFLNITVETAHKRARTRAETDDHWFHDEALITTQFETMEIPRRSAHVAIVNVDEPLETLEHEVLTITNFLALNQKLRATAEDLEASGHCRE